MQPRRDGKLLSSFAEAAFIRTALIAVMCLLLNALPPFASRCGAQGFTCSCLMEQRSVGANFNKVGKAEFMCDGGTPIHYYLSETLDTKGSMPSVNFTEHQTTSYSLTTLTYNGECNWICEPSTTYSGGGGIDCGDNGTCSFTFNSDGSVTSSGSSGCPFNNAYIANNLGGGGNPTGAFSWIHCDVYADNTTCSQSCTSTEQDAFATETNGTYSTKDRLDNEFTDEDVRGQLLGRIPDYPTEWSTGTGEQAYFSFDTNHFCMHLTKMVYRVKIPAVSEYKAHYLCKWVETTTTLHTDGSTTTTNIEPSLMEETITGTGDPVNPAYGDSHEIMLRGGPGDTITVQESAPTVIKIASGSDGGAGSGGGPGSHGGGPGNRGSSGIIGR